MAWVVQRDAPHQWKSRIIVQTSTTGSVEVQKWSCDLIDPPLVGIDWIIKLTCFQGNGGGVDSHSHIKGLENDKKDNNIEMK